MVERRSVVIEPLGLTLRFLDELRLEIEEQQYTLVAEMKEAGASWKEVGGFLARPISGQAAARRFTRERRRRRQRG